MVGALTDVQIRGLEYVHILQDNGADMLSQVLQSGMDKSFPGAARGVQRDQADCRAWMGLAGKKDAVLLLNSNMCSGICMLTYICARDVSSVEKVVSYTGGETSVMTQFPFSYEQSLLI
jgi:hypothetical protein